MVYGTRLSLNDKPDRACHFVHPLEVEAYMSAAHIVRFIGTVVHKLFGHGTGKLVAETERPLTASSTFITTTLPSAQ